MAHATPQGAKLLNGWKRLTSFEQGLGAQLPEAYKKFWREWKHTKPTAVHYVPKTGRWQRDELTGQVRPIQEHPIPLIDVPESHQGIWGGEAVIKGFQKRDRLKRRVPHFWVPVLRKSVVHSVVLGEYMSVVVTDRTINLIHESHGFDHYLLKTPACDLRSELALSLKRKILQTLEGGCQNLAGTPNKQKEVMAEFKKYLDGYTSEEIDWYGLTYKQAIKKLDAKIKAENPIVPHKLEFRSKLIEQLRQAGIEEAGKDDSEVVTKIPADDSKNWLSKMNPFGKKQET